MNRFVITAFILLTAAGTVVNFVLPEYNKLEANKQNVAVKEKELRVLDNYIVNLQNLVAELNNYKVQLSKIDTALPSDPSLPALFNFFQKMSAKDGLVLKSMNIVSKPAQDAEKKEGEKQVQEIYINIQVAGSYSAFKNLLFSLEKSARLIEVENISFSLDEKGEEGSSFNLSVKTHSY